MLQVSPQVQEAIDTLKPVVALESTIITHGMPYPANLNTALEVEQTIRDEGAVPATIGVINGVIKVGLSEQEITFLSQAKDVHKISLKDLSVAVAKKLSGGTTVSATMFAAYKAGIQVFATGGIGGVHRDARETFDISTDLEALGSIPITVVCAGAKAILDLPATLEYLETKGVLVVGYKTTEFPAFYYGHSGLTLEHSVSNPGQLAEIIRKRDALGIDKAILVGNPPPEEMALEKEHIEGLIQEALKAAKEQNIRGKEVTPFLLDYLAKHSQGETLETNIALVKNNAKVGSAVAKALMADKI
ncbi:pseudouridine-5'-phosphate glycosidase [Coprothermobacter platensis]|uniref:pseudouridine-5'-phosphate glycosidase n=1 Tax=Coprothermobacter platensis TaxID=108819 RepID=UPI000367B099|nr:pseudouridine-5'-phosphate glycosidase [Coprothermobacter platensis]